MQKNLEDIIPPLETNRIKTMDSCYAYTRALVGLPISCRDSFLCAQGDFLRNQRNTRILPMLSQLPFVY